MDDLYLHFQCHLVIFDLEFGQFGGNNAITKKIFIGSAPNLHRLCIKHGLRTDQIMVDLDLHFQGHFTIFDIKFGICNAITKKYLSSDPW